VNKRIVRVGIDGPVLTETTVVDIVSLGLEFDGNTGGLVFDELGNMFVASHDGDVILGTYAASTESFTFSTLLDIPENEGPSGDHGCGGMAIDTATDTIYLNCGAVKHGSPNPDSDPEPALLYNTRILRFQTNGTGLSEFARGVRHHFGLTIRRSDGVIFGGENSTDCHSAEEINRIEEGNHYGHPFKFGSDRNGSDSGIFSNCTETNPGGIIYTPSLANFGPDGRPASGEPGHIDGGVYYGLHPHSVPLGLSFYEPSQMAPGASLFPVEFHGRLFVGRFGQLISGIPDVGHDVISLRMDDGSGGYVANTFLEGLGRIIDVLAADNGNLYVLAYNQSTGGSSLGGGNSRLHEIHFDASTVPVSLSAFEVR
jgi:glucose/arabinose dehydrogenase